MVIFTPPGTVSVVVTSASLALKQWLAQNGLSTKTFLMNRGKLQRAQKQETPNLLEHHHGWKLVLCQSPLYAHCQPCLTAFSLCCWLRARNQLDLPTRPALPMGQCPVTCGGQKTGLQIYTLGKFPQNKKAMDAGEMSPPRIPTDIHYRYTI